MWWNQGFFSKINFKWFIVWLMTFILIFIQWYNELRGIMYWWYISSLDNNLTVVNTWLRSQSPLQLRFGYGPIFVHLNLQLSQEHSYGVCTCIISLTQSLYVWSMTPLLKSLVWVVPGQIRTQDFLIHKRILYHCTIESVISSIFATCPNEMFLVYTHNCKLC